MKKPKPHSVKAMLAFAPKELALLMYMMMGDAAIVQAQLKRLSFCRLHLLQTVIGNPAAISMQEGMSHLQPSDCYC